MGFQPFADEAAALRIGGLTAENRRDRVSLWGNLDLTRDRAGLRRARELRALLDAVVAALEGEGEDLPERVAPPEPPTTVKNPFG
jgi:hypothetical protein